MRILVATGGTGGHIYPALSLVEALKKKDPSADFLFVGSTDRMEAQMIPSLGYNYKSIECRGMNGSVIEKGKAALLLVSAYLKCKRIVKEFKPDFAIGFGNYISVPVLLAAHNAKVCTMIHEQNSYAGKANRLLARYVDAIVGCYKENLDQFPPEKTRILGNPRASQAANAPFERNVLKEYGLDPLKKTAVIVMGSLGSQSVNEKMTDLLMRLQGKKYQVLYVTGKAEYEAFIKKFPGNDCVKVVPYIDGLKVLRNVDFAIVRGGATTAAEITALGLPSIIIPSPYVPNNHQVLNAKVLMDQGASFMIEEKDFTSQAVIAKMEEILLDDIKLENMSKAAKKCGYIHANEDIIKWIEELKGVQHG